MTELSVVQRWLVRLHALIITSSSSHDARERIETVAPFLTSFPPGVFCQRSLEHVAAQFRFWPSYAELKSALSDWRRTFLIEERPALPAPEPEPAGANLADQERAAIIAKFRTEWAAMRAELLAKQPPEPALRPLRDVTLTGDALRRSREARGCHVPVPEVAE